MIKSVFTVFLLAGVLHVSGPAQAQAFYEKTKPTSGCPSIVLHVEKNGSALTGVAFYADGSGVSSIKGIDENGSFNWNLTSISGKGPSGSVVGTYAPDGAMKLKNTETGCTFSERLPPIRNPDSGGGG